MIYVILLPSDGTLSNSQNVGTVEGWISIVFGIRTEFIRAKNHFKIQFIAFFISLYAKFRIISKFGFCGFYGLQTSFKICKSEKVWILSHQWRDGFIIAKYTESMVYRHPSKDVKVKIFKS